MPVHGEPVDHRRRDGRAHTLGGGQLLLGGGFDGLEAAEFGRQCTSRGRPDMADRQGHQHPPQRLRLRLAEVGQQALAVGRQLAGLGGEQLGAQQIVGGEAEQVAFVGDDAGLQQSGRSLITQTLDVERATPGDVKHPLPQLRRARARVGAADVGITLLGGSEFGSALGTVGGHDELALGPVTQVHDGAEHLGDDVAGLADHHGVADEHALALDLRGVVQRGQPDGRPGHLDRFHVGERRDPAGPADVDADVEKFGGRLFRWVLVGDRPARRARGRSEPALQRHLVDLDHHPVDLVIDVVAVLTPVGDAFGHCFQTLDLCGVGRDRQAPLPQRPVGVVQ